ncbi:hypothetical protein V0R50_09090 [Pseudomonas sp. 148P]|uniref:Uncharacterized protein n=1 Tax=Pseudomonas ulcerans TaxID=3115852 RepID=A0ABU7HPC2_9PSED|nr:MULTISPECIES: hypothetical protein [unclassified Pseudomonas]MEE1920595.1 hypothetical protein [Pseudomonas sp. 147P]MEE1933377.1 hypothetical protein [Pseudomonas sp. 148P]
MNITLIGSLLLGLVAPVFAQTPVPLNDDTQGHVSVRDNSNRHCNIPVGPTGSGLDRQWEFSADLSPCKSLNNKAREIGFYNLPSATQIIFTDSETCQTSSEPAKNSFWFKLKTIKKVTQPEAFTMAFPYTHANGEILAVGIQLVDKYINGDSINALDKLSCIRVINSRSTRPMAVAPIGTAPRAWQGAGSEEDSKFHCGGDFIMIGRAHIGDEEKKTDYRCATASQASEGVTLKNHREDEGQDENDSYYVCPVNTVMTGREHDGSETGKTRYTCAEAWIGNDRLEVRPDTWSAEVPEKNHMFECDINKVLIGRRHGHDENSETQYRCGTLYRLPPP